MKIIFIGVGIFTVGLAIYLTWMQLMVYRPQREKEIASKLGGSEFHLLERLSKSGKIRAIGLTLLQTELKGMKDAEDVAKNSLKSLEKKGCVTILPKNKYQSTGKGIRVYQYAAKRRTKV